MKFFTVGNHIINISNILYVKVDVRNDEGEAEVISIYFAGGGRDDIYSYVSLRDKDEIKSFLEALNYSDD